MQNVSEQPEFGGADFVLFTAVCQVDPERFHRDVNVHPIFQRSSRRSRGGFHSVPCQNPVNDKVCPIGLDVQTMEDLARQCPLIFSQNDSRRFGGHQ